MSHLQTVIVLIELVLNVCGPIVDDIVAEIEGIPLLQVQDRLLIPVQAQIREQQDDRVEVVKVRLAFLPLVVLFWLIQIFVFEDRQVLPSLPRFVGELQLLDLHNAVLVP